MSEFDDFYEDSWSTQRATESVTDGLVTRTWATNLSNLRAVHYQASSDEIESRQKQEIEISGFIEMDALNSAGNLQDVLSKDRFISPRGEVYEVSGHIENPHSLNEFYKIPVVRRDTERVSDE